MRSEIMAEYSFKNYLLENYVMLIMLLGIYLLYFNSRKVIRVRSERIMPVIGAGILLSSILEYLDGYYSTFTDTMIERKLINALGYSIYSPGQMDLCIHSGDDQHGVLYFHAVRNSLHGVF